jgi:hypothetical protein
VGIVVNKMAQGQILLQIVEFSPTSCHYTSASISHPLSGAGTIGPFVVTVLRDLAHLKNKKKVYSSDQIVPSGI